MPNLRLMIRFVVLIPLMTTSRVFGSVCHADDCSKGAWKGTIGKTPVMIEFFEIGSREKLAGRYYYRTNLADLLLKTDETEEDSWQEYDPEDKLTGVLTLTCGDDGLSGEWKSPDGKTTLPIRAEKTKSYSKPRMDAVKPKAVKHVAMGKNGYEILSVGNPGTVRGVRLAGNTEVIRKINSELLRKYLSDIEDFFDCTSYAKSLYGSGDYESRSEVISWNEDFVVISHSGDYYCGGAHPFESEKVITYELRSGKQENVSLWLNEPYRKGFRPDTALGKIVSKAYLSLRKDDGDECLEYIDFFGFGIWPTNKGLAFSTSTAHVSRYCKENVMVPYKTILPYLTPRGRECVRSFGSR